VLLAPFALVGVPRDRPDECSLTLAGDCVLLFREDERVGLRYELLYESVSEFSSESSLGAVGGVGDDSAEEDEELDEGVRLVCVLDSECFKTSRRS